MDAVIVIMISGKVTSIVHSNRQNRNGNREALGRVWVVFVELIYNKTVWNEGTFHTFREEEIAELLPKNIARIMQEYN